MCVTFNISVTRTCISGKYNESFKLLAEDRLNQYATYNAPGRFAIYEGDSGTGLYKIIKSDIEVKIIVGN